MANRRHEWVKARRNRTDTAFRVATNELARLLDKKPEEVPEVVVSMYLSLKGDADKQAQFVAELIQSEKSQSSTQTLPEQKRLESMMARFKETIDQSGDTPQPSGRMQGTFTMDATRQLPHLFRQAAANAETPEEKSRFEQLAVAINYAFDRVSGSKVGTETNALSYQGADLTARKSGSCDGAEVEITLEIPKQHHEQLRAALGLTPSAVTEPTLVCPTQGIGSGRGAA